MDVSGKIAIVGTGFVADLYMRSIEVFPGICVAGAFDRDSVRLEAFSSYWNVPKASNFEELLNDPSISIILNLTNPNSHFEISNACLQAGKHVYSEKPLAMSFADAEALHVFAKEKGLYLSSAPCSLLGRSAQTLWKALRDEVIGQPRLVFAELDDGFITQAPYQFWRSETGAPWPYEDEFRIGCTLEHAGYYLGWLIAMFGEIKSVTAATATLGEFDLSTGEPAPDFSVATLHFRSGVAARITCSILAPHNHEIKIVGDKGALEVKECWDNEASVRFRRRLKIRRRLIENPITEKIKAPKTGYPAVKRRGAAAMNFALGVADMLEAISEQRTPRLSSEFSLHMTEAALAIHNAAHHNGRYEMKTECGPIAPMPWAT